MPINQELLTALEAISSSERTFTSADTNETAETLFGEISMHQPTLQEAFNLGAEAEWFRDQLFQDCASFKAAVVGARGLSDRSDARWRLRRDYGHRVGTLARDLIVLIEARGTDRARDQGIKR